MRFCTVVVVDVDQTSQAHLAQARGCKARNRAGRSRELGLQEAVALGIGGTVGGGILVLVGATERLAGPAMVLAFVVAFVPSLATSAPVPVELSFFTPQVVRPRGRVVKAVAS